MEKMAFRKIPEALCTFVFLEHLLARATQDNILYWKDHQLVFSVPVFLNVRGKQPGVFIFTVLCLSASSIIHSAVPVPYVTILEEQGALTQTHKSFIIT